MPFGKILSFGSSALAVILAIPTFLILLTWNTLPGEPLYSLKRGLENVPRMVFATDKTLAANYETVITDRRFGEAVTLVKKKNNQGLTELRSAIKATTAKVKSSKDLTVQKKYLTQLNDYRNKLEAEKTKIVIEKSQVQILAINNTPQNQVVDRNSNRSPENTGNSNITNIDTRTTVENSAPAGSPGNNGNTGNSGGSPQTGNSNTNQGTGTVTPPPPPDDPSDQTLEELETTEDEIDAAIEELEKKENEDLDSLTDQLNNL